MAATGCERRISNDWGWSNRDEFRNVVKAPERPNFLFLFPDQHRWDWVGGHPAVPLRTLNLDRLSARGTTFSHAFTPSPLCSPARACLATGRDYPGAGVTGNSQTTPATLPNYYRALREGGYEVAGVGKFDLHKPDMDWGLDGRNRLSEYGFTSGCDNEGKGDAIFSYQKNGMSPKGPYMQFLQKEGLVETHMAMYEPYLGKPDWLNFPAVTGLPDHAYCDNWVADNGLRCLRGFAKDKPWHLVVNFVGPHGPFDVTQGMRERWESVDLPPPVANREPDPDIILERRQNYAAMIENIDLQVGHLLAAVEERGEMENTMIVYSSDHGEMLGDHGRWGKVIWRDPSVRVPLIVAGPGVLENTKSGALTAIHDLGATFLDYAGLPPLPDSNALSLRGVLEGKRNTHRHVVRSGLASWRMVFDGRFKLVTEEATAPKLFDLHFDPEELQDIAAQNPNVVSRLMTSL